MSIFGYVPSMEFLEPILAYAGLLALIAIIASPIIIFSATPRMPLWYRSGRILFLWFCAIAISGIGLYETLSDPEEIKHWGIKEDAYQHYILLHLWFIFLMNIYIGWFEFFWRCVYRQWAWPLLKNLKYGLISNMCILSSAVFTIPLALFLVVVGIVKIIY